MEVLRGSTAINSRSALSALLASMRRNTPQPASRIDRLRPALLGTLRPAWPWCRAPTETCSRSVALRGRSRRADVPGRARPCARGQAAGGEPYRAVQRLEHVPSDAECCPADTGREPAARRQACWRCVRGGEGWERARHLRVQVERRRRRAGHTSGWWTRMCPTLCRYSRCSPAVESHRQPSRSEGHSTVSNQPAPLNRGNPGVRPAWTRRKNASNARPSRRRVACWEENTSGPVRPDRLGGCREAERTARRSAPTPDASAKHRAAPAGRRCTALGGHRASRPARRLAGGRPQQVSECTSHRARQEYAPTLGQ